MARAKIRPDFVIDNVWNISKRSEYKLVLIEDDMKSNHTINKRDRKPQVIWLAINQWNVNDFFVEKAGIWNNIELSVGFMCGWMDVTFAQVPITGYLQGLKKS